MKINEITESWYDKLSAIGQTAKRAGAQQKIRQQTDKNAGITQAIGQFKPNPSRAIPPSQQVAQNQQSHAGDDQSTGGWFNTDSGVQIKPASGKNPTFAKYNKQIYALTKDDQWIDLRDKPVSAAMMALLNQALEQT